MLVWLNRWLDRPWKRLSFVISALVVFLVLRISAGTVWQARLSALIPGGVALLMMRRSWYSWAGLRRGLMRREMRLVKSLRILTKRSAGVHLLHMFSLSLVFASFVLIVLGWKTIADAVMYATIAILSLAGLIDAVALTARLLKYAWMPALGKVLSLTVFAAMAAVSLALAKSLTHNLAHIDPKYLSEFTLVATCVTIPMVYLVLISAILFAVAAAQIIILVMLIAGNMVAQQFAPLVGMRWQTSVRLYGFRLRHGKRPSGGRLPSTAFMSQDEISMIAAPISKLALGAVIWCVVQFFISGYAIAVPMLKDVLVFLEYRPQSACINLRREAAVAYMENGFASVAAVAPGGYKFSVVNCELRAEKPPGESD